MGYKTKFDLEIEQGEGMLSYYKKDIGDIVGMDVFSGDRSSWGGIGREAVMRKYSQYHPDTVFKISGKGDNDDDIWVEYYKNGKIQEAQARIIIDPYDETKLK